MANCTQAPQWSNKLTIDVALPKLEQHIAQTLQPFAGQPISRCWSRISKSARQALEAWYAAL